MFTISFLNQWSEHLTVCIRETREDSDEMQHRVAFHYGLHCMLRYKKASIKNLQTKKKQYFKNNIKKLTLLHIYNGPSQVYCIKPVGRTRCKNVSLRTKHKYFNQTDML